MSVTMEQIVAIPCPICHQEAGRTCFGGYVCKSRISAAEREERLKAKASRKAS